MADPSQLAERFLDGDHDAALAAALDGGPDRARFIADAIARALVQDAELYGNEWPRGSAWFDHQHAVRSLADVPGVDADSLAGSLAYACTRQRVDGAWSPLDDEIGRWMIDRMPETVIAAAMDTAAPGHRFLAEALSLHHGDEAREWVLAGYVDGLGGPRTTYDAGTAGDVLAHRAPSEWSRRIHLLCESDLAAAPFVPARERPSEVCAAFVRYACRFASAATDDLIVAAAAEARRHRTGDPVADVALFWWGPAEHERLRTVLELSGPPGSRQEVVAAARLSERIDDAQAAFLAADVARPPWADAGDPGEVPQRRREPNAICPQVAPGDRWSGPVGTVTVRDVVGERQGFMRTDAIVFEHADRAWEWLPVPAFLERYERVA